MWNSPIQSALLPQLASGVPGSVASATAAATIADAQQAPRVTPAQQTSASPSSANNRRRDAQRDSSTSSQSDSAELESITRSTVNNDQAYDQAKVLRGTMDYLRKVIDPDVIDGESESTTAQGSASAKYAIDSDDFTPIDSLDDVTPAASPAPVINGQTAREPGSRLDIEA
jgi:hypothetical protein